MIIFKTAYRDAGFVPCEDELPDYLPMVLDFAALCPRGERLLHAHRADLELLRRALVKAGTPVRTGGRCRVRPAAQTRAPGDRPGPRGMGVRTAQRGRRPRTLRPAGVPDRLRRGHHGPTRGDRLHGGTTMNNTAAQLFWWVALPYLALGIFVVGHVWRWRYDQFGWTSRSTQLQERRMLKWGGPLFHYGTFAAIAGHVIGILIPERWTRAIGIPENAYRWFSAAAGTLAAVLVIGGVVVLATRRMFVPRVRATTDPIDYVTLILLLVIILTGIAPTIAINLFGHGYDYRTTVAPWFRGLFSFAPSVQRHRTRPVHLPAARDRGLVDLGAVAVQPAGTRLELPRLVPLAAVRRLSQPPGEPAGRTRHRRTQVAQDRCPLLTVPRRPRSVVAAGRGRPSGR